MSTDELKRYWESVAPGTDVYADNAYYLGPAKALKISEAARLRYEESRTLDFKLKEDHD